MNKNGLYSKRVENERAWRVPLDQIKAGNYNLDLKNAHNAGTGPIDVDHLLAEYEQLLAQIAETRDKGSHPMKKKHFRSMLSSPNACGRLWGMTITVPLPEALEQTMLPSRAKLYFAIGAFAAEELTLGQAAEIAGVSQTELMRELSRRRIPLHYDRADFAEDLRTIAGLNAKLDHARRQ